MDEIKRLHELYLLKEVDRVTNVKERYESTAEHIYSTLILAFYFISKIEQKLDQVKVTKLLLYHDLEEIYTGDFDSMKGDKEEIHRKDEERAFCLLQEKIPLQMKAEYGELWKEFREGQTMESRFCHAIYKLDPVIHTIFKKHNWTKEEITEQKIRAKKEKYFKDFPAIQEFFNQLIEYAKMNGYF